MQISFNQSSLEEKNQFWKSILQCICLVCFSSCLIVAQFGNHFQNTPCTHCVQNLFQCIIAASSAHFSKLASKFTLDCELLRLKILNNNNNFTILLQIRTWLCKIWQSRKMPDGKKIAQPLVCQIPKGSKSPLRRIYVNVQSFF